MELDEVLAVVQARAWYLRCRLTGEGWPEGEGWLGADRVVADPERLAALVARTGAARGATRASVAAALFVQSYAFQVAGVAVAAWALGLPSPTLEPSLVAVHVSRSRIDDLAVRSGDLVTHNAGSLAAALIDGHLEPMVDAVRGAVRVGERAVWGNVASSVAAVLRSVDGPGPAGDPGVRARGESLFRASAVLAEQGAWRSGSGWTWERRSCCLWLCTAEAAGGRCADCTLARRP